MRKISNLELSRNIKRNYSVWKEHSLKTESYFIIFSKFASEKLKLISGNAMKLYIYLGINSNNKDGEVWHSNKKIAEYFGKSERTIRTWMKELERLNLIYRIQLNFNEESHTYLQPYIVNEYIKNERYSYIFRFKNLFNRRYFNFLLFEDRIIRISNRYFKSKLYFRFYETYFEIYTYAALNKELLNSFPKHLTSNLIDKFQVYFSLIEHKVEEDTIIDKKFIIENFKNTNRYY